MTILPNDGFASLRVLIKLCADGRLGDALFKFPLKIWELKVATVKSFSHHSSCPKVHFLAANYLLQIKWLEITVDGQAFELVDSGLKNFFSRHEKYALFSFSWAGANLQLVHQEIHRSQRVLLSYLKRRRELRREDL